MPGSPAVSKPSPCAPLARHASSLGGWEEAEPPSPSISLSAREESREESVEALVEALRGEWQALVEPLFSSPEAAAKLRRELVAISCLTGAVAGDDGLRLAIARQAEAPGMVLAWLSKDPSEEVRIAVAGNPGTPAEVLRALNSCDLMQYAVAGNPSAPVDVLLGLARHWDKHVRRKVAYNSSSPPELRRTLLGDPAGRQSNQE